MRRREAAVNQRAQLDFLSGGGAMGERIRSLDWSATALGPLEHCSQSLGSALSICLGSRFPIVIYWGAEYTVLYNDAYAEILGKKHPWALGRPCRDVWSEIWNVIAPMLDGVRATGEATWSEDQLLFLERGGYPEECYFSFSFSPVWGAPGAVEGIFTAVIENTRRVVSERRLQLLRDVGARTGDAKTAEEACAMAAATLAAHGKDVPFALLYLTAGETARLAGASGVAIGERISPEAVDLRDSPGSPWPLADAGRTESLVVVERLNERFSFVPRGPWPDPPHTAVIAPIPSTKPYEPAGAMVAGVSARMKLDERYRDFFTFVASQIGTSIANARAHEEEKRRAEALAEIDRAKTAFFSNVSHEFRTPLTLMLGPIEDLLRRADGELPAAAREQLELAHRNSMRLLKLVNTLLDFSRIEAGRIQASYEPLDLAAFTSDLASVFRSAAERAGLRLIVDCPPVGEDVFVDREMWEKIVFNLLSNAFKFTFEGEIEVRLRRAGGWVECSVRDTGTGIDAAELPHVFERFHRVRGARGRTLEGSGIGLALVQELVRLHGGTVSATSELDRGSCFTVSIPLGKAHLPAARIDGARAPSSTALRGEVYLEEALRWLPAQDGRTAPGDLIGATTWTTPAAPRSVSDGAPLPSSLPRVLLADDNADMREYVRRLLGAEYEVEAVADGAAALSAARTRTPPFDLILTDIMMPELDGLGLLAAVRADERLNTTPVILLSARAGEEARVEGMHAGANDYLIKPFSARELLARVRANVEMARLRRESERQLRESERRKDEFLATLAHELRNPLAPLRYSLHLLREIAPHDHVRTPLHDMMERQVKHLVRLVDDLMEVSRITRGTLELRREWVELSAIVRNAIDTSDPLVQSSDRRLRVTLPTEPVVLDGDPVRLAQVLANLLNNAAQHTTAGGEISVQARRDGDGVSIAVRDDGVGIEPEMLPRIFEMFSRGRRASRAQGGLGIGLALARRLVEMHGGTLDARSDGPGAGSEFIIRLPVMPAPVSGPAGPPPETLPVTPRRVLVVEDNRDAADSLAAVLELFGAEVRVASDGREALELNRDFRPALILLDLGMPDMDGYEVARRIRAEPSADRPTIVALTGWGQESDRRRTSSEGFDHHLVKPVEPRSLQQLLASVEAHPA
jgi:signal transduction histidine kinase